MSGIAFEDGSHIREFKVHIVYCSDRYWPALGGAETYLRTITQEMSKFHQVSIITVVRGENTLVETLCGSSKALKYIPSYDGAVRVITLKLPPILRAAAHILRLENFAHRLSRKSYFSIRSSCIHYTAHLLAYSLRKEIRDADIIHSLAPWELSHAVNLARYHVPHVITGFLHSGYWADDVNSLRHFRRCDHIIALSNTERQEYEQFDIPKERISVVGVPVREPPLLDYEFSRIQPIQMDKPFVLFLGAKRPYKGIDILLEAIPHVWAVNPEVQFVFAGPRTSYSKTLFANVIPDPRIIEVGEIVDEDMWKMLKACRFLCLPSATEIMPNVILEAWSMRKAVVVSDIPALQELVDGAGLCVLRDEKMWSKALLQLLQYPEVAASYGELGWQKCMRENKASTIRAKLEKVYDAVIKRY